MPDYRLKNSGGLVLASVSGPDPQASNGIMHYAAMYATEGPVKVERRVGKAGWKPYGQQRGESDAG